MQDMYLDEVTGLVILPMITENPPFQSFCHDQL
jgi:hypothetical protein